MISFQFLMTSLIVVLIPGTGVIFTVSTGLALGRKASVYAALGCTAGIIPHLFATIFGLAAVMHTSAMVFQTLKYAGAVYLAYLALATWKDKSAFSLESINKTTGGKLAAKAFFLNILNPKLTIFFLAFLPQFVDPAKGSPLSQLLLLSAVFMVMTFIVFVGYGYLAHAFRRYVIGAAGVQRVLRLGFGAVFAGLAAKLALSEK